MAGTNGYRDSHVRVTSRRLVKASDSTIKPHVVAVANLDLLPQPMPVSMVCMYPNNKPPATDFDAVVAAFESGLPSFLNHFFLFAGRIATNSLSGLPEVSSNNQGAELVVGESCGVALASLDDGTTSQCLHSMELPFAANVALSVQVVSFACGGFTVAWRTNHLLVDGSAMSLLVTSWSELARTGTLSVSAMPNHNRSLLRPRSPPSYGASVDDMFTPLDDTERQVNVLTTQQSFVERLYHIEASDVARLREAARREEGGRRATRVEAVSAYLWKALAGVVVGTADTRCRMTWNVDGRQRLTASSPELRSAATLRNYVGNVTTSVIREADVEEVLRMPLPDVAAMVREAIAASDYGEHFQELVDWVEEHKNRRYVHTANLGLGSPTLCVAAFASFPLDTDFGFGHAALAVPTSELRARMCSGRVGIMAKPGGDGSLIASGYLWPQLAAALESDEPRVFKPVTAEYLGLSAPLLRLR
nr:unnamed protein product [Digitaria exilis]